MPIYEYQCKACGDELEVMQKISDTPLTNCPKCGKNSLEKVISPTKFQLKGTGWYATDFKSSGKPKKEDTTSSKEGSSEKKADTKPPSSDSE